MSNQIEPHGPLSTGRLDPVSDQGALSSIVFPSRSITPEGHDFPIDRTSIDFYSARQLRSALLHHPGIEKDKKNIYIESASYCRQQQKGAREFIIFNVHNTTSGQTASSVLLLDPGIESHTSSSVSCSDSHSAQCLPLLFNLMKPSFWKSLKNPGHFYFPGCLENTLESRGLAAYQELEKIVFEHEKPFDIESFVVLASAISSPSSLYQKKLAQTPFWFPIILWNLMKRFPSNITLMPGAAADMVQKLTPGNVDKLLKRFHVELARFRIELGANLSGRDAQSSDALSTSSEESPTLQSTSQEHEQTLLQPPGVSYALQTELQEMPNLPSSLQVPRDLSVQEMFDSLVKDGCADLSTLIDFDSFSQCAIANGGFGEVWKTQMKNGDPVAVKCLRSLTDDKKGKKRAMRELNHWSKAHHENIQELLGIIMFQGRLGMVSKWMENGDLRQFIEKNPDADRYQLCLQVATGISYLHGIGMVHGDIKAANILVSADGIAKIADFDHSIFSESTLRFSETTRRGGGTTRWMAPELLLQEDDNDSPSITRNEQTDVYALAMTILEILTGKKPYQEIKCAFSIYRAVQSKRLPKRPQQLRDSDKQADKIWALLIQCWDRDPESRPDAASVLISLINLQH